MITTAQQRQMLVCPIQSREALDNPGQAVRQGTALGVEVVALRKDKTTFVVGMNMTPIDAAGSGQVHSVIGSGTTFTIHLPVQRDSAAEGP